MDFFKKKRLTVGEILKAIEALSDEDKQTLQDQLNEIYSDDPEEPEEEVMPEHEEEGDVPEEETEDISEEKQEATETETPTDEEEVPEAQPEPEEETPEAEAPKTLENDNADQEWKNKIESELAQIKQLLTGLSRQPKQANETASSKLERLARKFE